MWAPATQRQHSRDDLRYGSDLSDVEWAIIGPLMPLQARTGRSQRWPMREIANAIFYVLRGGIAWRLLPKDSPPATTVYGWFLRFRREGVFEIINHHAVMRERVGRDLRLDHPKQEAREGRRRHHRFR